MPKMGFEALLDELEKDQTWPGTTIQRYVVAAEDLKKYSLQRKKGVDATHYSIWALGIGVTGGQFVYFYGHRLLDAAKKAYEWKTSAQPAKAAG